jgi:tRNA-Thr(GGU) m(6)t(6)A37 methyltransferase TsaA
MAVEQFTKADRSRVSRALQKGKSRATLRRLSSTVLPNAMDINQISFKPIGIIHTPFTELEGMPIQPSAGKGVKGHILLNEIYLDGLADLDGFSHIWILYHLHLSDSHSLKVVPFLDDQLRGVFSTRAPRRPNSIGLSVVRLNKIVSNRLDIENVDVIDGSPLLDIKPYVPEMDEVDGPEIGWLSKHSKDIHSKKSDQRFK